MVTDHVRQQSVFMRAVFSLFLAMFLSSCTTTTITPKTVQSPARNVDVVAIGDIESDDEIWGSRIPYLRRGLLARLREEGGFAGVLDGTPSVVSENGITVSGKVTEVDKGNRALRFIIGFGAGRAIAAGSFQIIDRDGAILAQFEVRKAYSGGAGIGGLDMLDMDELMQKLGEETADSIIRWANGESLEPPKAD